MTVPEAGVSLVLEPAELKREPRSEYEGKFSLQYSVASLLVRGHVDVGDFTDEAITDPRVLSVASRVRYETPDYPTYPQAFPGGVVVRLRDGSTLENDLAYQRGGPENPLADEDVVRKYRTNAGLALQPEAVAALEEAILALKERDDLHAVLSPLSLREVAAV